MGWFDRTYTTDDVASHGRSRRDDRKGSRRDRDPDRDRNGGSRKVTPHGTIKKAKPRDDDNYTKQGRTSRNEARPPPPDTRTTPPPRDAPKQTNPVRPSGQKGDESRPAPTPPTPPRVSTDKTTAAPRLPSDGGRSSAQAKPQPTGDRGCPVCQEPRMTATIRGKEIQAPFCELHMCLKRPDGPQGPCKNAIVGESTYCKTDGCPGCHYNSLLPASGNCALCTLKKQALKAGTRKRRDFCIRCSSVVMETPPDEEPSTVCKSHKCKTQQCYNPVRREIFECLSCQRGFPPKSRKRVRERASSKSKPTSPRSASPSTSSSEVSSGYDTDTSSSGKSTSTISASPKGKRVMRPGQLPEQSLPGMGRRLSQSSMSSFNGNISNLRGNMSVSSLSETSSSKSSISRENVAPTGAGQEAPRWPPSPKVEDVPEDDGAGPGQPPPGAKPRNLPRQTSRSSLEGGRPQTPKMSPELEKRIRDGDRNVNKNKTITMKTIAKMRPPPSDSMRPCQMCNNLISASASGREPWACSSCTCSWVGTGPDGRKSRCTSVKLVKRGSGLCVDHHPDREQLEDIDDDLIPSAPRRCLVRKCNEWPVVTRWPGGNFVKTRGHYCEQYHACQGSERCLRRRGACPKHPDGLNMRKSEPKRPTVGDWIGNVWANSDALVNANADAASVYKSMSEKDWESSGGSQSETSVSSLGSRDSRGRRGSIIDGKSNKGNGGKSTKGNANGGVGATANQPTPGTPGQGPLPMTTPPFNASSTSIHSPQAEPNPPMMANTAVPPEMGGYTRTCPEYAGHPSPAADGPDAGSQDATGAIPPAGRWVMTSTGMRRVEEFPAMSGIAERYPESEGQYSEGQYSESEVGYQPAAEYYEPQVEQRAPSRRKAPKTASKASSSHQRPRRQQLRLEYHTNDNRQAQRRRLPRQLTYSGHHANNETSTSMVLARTPQLPTNNESSMGTMDLYIPPPPPPAVGNDGFAYGGAEQFYNDYNNQDYAYYYDGTPTHEGYYEEAQYHHEHVRKEKKKHRNGRSTRSSFLGGFGRMGRPKKPSTKHTKSRRAEPERMPARPAPPPSTQLARVQCGFSENCKTKPELYAVTCREHRCVGLDIESPDGRCPCARTAEGDFCEEHTCTRPNCSAPCLPTADLCSRHWHVYVSGR